MGKHFPVRFNSTLCPSNVFASLINVPKYRSDCAFFLDEGKMQSRVTDARLQCGFNHQLCNGKSKKGETSVCIDIIRPIGQIQSSRLCEKYNHENNKLIIKQTHFGSSNDIRSLLSFSDRWNVHPPACSYLPSRSVFLRELRERALRLPRLTANFHFRT